MARFVIAGASDCPRLALIEVVANELQLTLPDFRIHKIQKDKAEWPKWLQGICEQNGWCHRQSPIVWRELIERGSKGELIGNASDFLEYVHAYYGPPTTYPTSKLLHFAYENKLEYDAAVARNLALTQAIEIVHVCVMPACSKAAHMILLEVTNGRILFGKCQYALYDDELVNLRFKKQLVVHIYCHSNHEEQLCHLREELLSLSRPMVRDIVVATDFQTAFQGCSLIIMVEDKTVVACGLEPPEDNMTAELLAFSEKFKSYGNTLSSLRTSYLIHREVHPGRKVSRRICFRKKRSSTSAVKLEAKETEKDISLSEKKTTASEDSLEKKRKSSSKLIQKEAEVPAMDRLGMSVSTLLSYGPVLSLEDKRLQNLLVDTTLFKNKWQKTVEIGRFISKHAEPKCKVLLVGESNLNFLAYVLATNFPHLAMNIVTVTDLENRIRGILASKLEILLHEVNGVHIWGDPSDVYYVDIFHATVENSDGAVWKETGYEQSFKDVFPYWKWLQMDFNKELQQFKEHRQKLLGSRRSCLPLINNALDVLERWLCPENLAEEMVHVRSVGVPSNGLYDIPEDFVLTCPVILCDGCWHPVYELKLPHLSKDKINHVAEKCLRMQYMYKLSHYLYDEAELDLEWKSILAKIIPPRIEITEQKTEESEDEEEETVEEEAKEEKTDNNVFLRIRDFYREGVMKF